MRRLDREETVAVLTGRPATRRTCYRSIHRGAAFLMAAALLAVSVPTAPMRVQAEENELVIRTVEEFLESGKACTSESY